MGGLPASHKNGKALLVILQLANTAVVPYATPCRRSCGWTKFFRPCVDGGFTVVREELVAAWSACVLSVAFSHLFYLVL